jgi:hypothetical protein
MQSIENMPSEAVDGSANKFLVNTLAIVCGLAVIVFICAATPGVDPSLGFF